MALLVVAAAPRTAWAVRGIVSLQTDSPQGTPTHVCVVAALGMTDNYVDIVDVAKFPRPSSIDEHCGRNTAAQAETCRILRAFDETSKERACGEECYARPEVPAAFKERPSDAGAPSEPTCTSSSDAKCDARPNAPVPLERAPRSAGSPAATKSNLPNPNREVLRPVVACVENKYDGGHDTSRAAASTSDDPANAARPSPRANPSTPMRVLFVGVSFDAKPMTKSSRAVADLFLAGNVLSFEIVKPPPDFLQVFVLGGSYTPTAGGRSSGTLSGAVVAANLPVHLQCNTHTIVLPPRWPDGAVSIELDREGPACAVQGSGLRRDTVLPWSSDRARRIISVRRTDADFPRAIAVQSSPTDTLLEAKFSTIGFVWQADPLYAWPAATSRAPAESGGHADAKVEYCPEVTFPSEGVACDRARVEESDSTSSSARRCRYVCRTKGFESLSLPATARFKHDDGSEWEDLVLEPDGATLRGYTPLPQRALHVHFGDAWGGLRMQVGLTFEDGRQFYPTVRPGGETVLQIPGLRSGATIKVRTFGPRTYEDRDIEIGTEHLFLAESPEVARRPVTIHAGLGAGLGLIADHSNLDPAAHLYVLPAAAVTLGASYAWRDHHQIEGQLVTRYTHRPTFPFANAAGDSSAAETFGYFHFSLQGLYVQRYKSWQFGGGPGADWALPASPSNTDKGGGNDWMVSANLTARWQPSNFTRVLLFIDPSVQFLTDLPVWRLQRDGSVEETYDRHVPFTILLGVRGEWSPFPRSLPAEPAAKVSSSSSARTLATRGR